MQRSPWLNKNTSLFAESSGRPPVQGRWRVLISSGGNSIRAMTAPARALGPTLQPIFSLLVVETSQPRTHTSSLAGCSKGPVTNLFCWGRYLLSFPPWPPHATKAAPPAGSVVGREHREVKGWGPPRRQPCPPMGHHRDPLCRLPHHKMGANGTQPRSPAAPGRTGLRAVHTGPGAQNLRKITDAAEITDEHLQSSFSFSEKGT